MKRMRQLHLIILFCTAFAEAIEPSEPEKHETERTEKTSPGERIPTSPGKKQAGVKAKYLNNNLVRRA